MLKLAIIADDLTGANDTAVQFAKYGINSCVWLNFAKKDLLSETAEVIVFDTDSRDITPSAAYDKVEKVCQNLYHRGVRNVYKKIDSTLRGNLGTEIEAAAAVLNPDIVVIAPAFPQNNRITVGGYHLINQIPVSLTEFARDPKTPVTESRISALLQQQTKCKIGSMPLNVVMQGTGAIQEHIANSLAQGEKWIVFDAVLDEHLQAIAMAVQDYGNILWGGSAGLAERLLKLYDWTLCSPRSISRVQGPVLFVAGSVSQITRRQISFLLQQSATQLVKLDVPNVLSHKDREITRCITAAKALLAAGRDVVIASAIDVGDVDRAVAAGMHYGFNKIQVSDQTAVALGVIAADLSKLPLAGMVLTGGDTAVHVCRALGVEAIEILDEVAVGMPLGKLIGEDVNGLKVVTKAGAFGDDQAFIQAVQAIKGK